LGKWGTGILATEQKNGMVAAAAVVISKKITLLQVLIFDKDNKMHKLDIPFHVAAY
jgi:hypothetical protein